MTHILLIIKMAGCAYCLFFSAGMGIAYKPQVLPFASQAPQPSAETSAGVHGGGGSLNRRLIASWHRAAEPGAGGRQGGRARECGRKHGARATGRAHAAWRVPEGAGACRFSRTLAGPAAHPAAQPGQPGLAANFILSTVSRCLSCIHAIMAGEKLGIVLSTLFHCLVLHAWNQFYQEEDRAMMLLAQCNRSAEPGRRTGQADAAGWLGWPPVVQEGLRE